MRLGKSLIGNPVFDVNDGRKLGTVKDLYLDDDLTHVTALYLGREGLLRPTPIFLKSADIALFGLDAVLAKSTATVYEGDEVPTPPDWLRLDQLRGREVNTPGGTKIGRIDDILLDAAACVSGFSLSHLSVKGPIAESKTVTRDAMVDTGSEDGVMTVDLPRAEREEVRIDPEALFPEPAEEEPSEEVPGVAQEQGCQEGDDM